MTSLSCRFCRAPLEHQVVDLGSSPLANSYLTPETLERAEVFLPLAVYVCTSCWLAQLPAVATPEEIFSYSTSWLDHARRYVEAMIERFGFAAGHQVVEIASNDGYLLRFFRERGVPVLGIEPAANVAAAAVELGIPTEVRFFGEAAARDLVARGLAADLLLGNNVLAHVPDLNDFVAGLATLLAPGGGFVFAPVHNVQADIPPEKVLAVFETARACGDYRAMRSR
jgi:SAM-dependent methyltransferase